MANCGVEIAFAPKELKVAQELSERLGYWTYQSRSRSRPSGLSGGHGSVSESDQRRALMLPQELIQMPASRLIVLRAGLPPVRGRKIVYWRERAFARRVAPPPVVPVRIDATVLVDLRSSTDARHGAPTSSTRGAERDDLTLALPDLEAAGLQPPAPGASEAEVEAWVDQFIDSAARGRKLETDHAR